MKVADHHTIRPIVATALLMAGLLSWPEPSAGEERGDVIVYRCELEDGGVVFQDRPCREDGERVELPPPPPPEVVEQAQARAERMIERVQARTERIRAEQRQRREAARSQPPAALRRPPAVSPHPYHVHPPVFIHDRRDRVPPAEQPPIDLEALRDGPALPTAPEPPEIMGLPGRPRGDDG